MRKTIIAFVALVCVSFAGAAQAQYYCPNPGAVIVQGVTGGILAQRPYYPYYRHRRFYRPRIFCRIERMPPYGRLVRVCRYL